MRALSYFLIVLGVFIAAVTAYNEFFVKRSPEEQYILLDNQLVSNKNPEDFGHALTVGWCSAGLTLLLGVGMFLAVRRQDRLDPLSPGFDWRDDESEK
jgi:hypothetical protein